MASLKITLHKSPISQKQNQQLTVKSLGLRKVRQTVILPDNASALFLHGFEMRRKRQSLDQS